MAFLDQGASRRGGNRPITTYPHPFFDPSQAYMPPTFKELIRWCLYLYTTHAEIAPAINKKVAYILTDLVYDTQTEQAATTWKKFFEETLRFRSMQFQLGVDFEVYGNAFASILYPFDRFLECRACGYFAHDRRVDWTYDSFRFRGTCPKCKTNGEMIPMERESKVRSRCRIARWNPQYIEIRYNAFTRRSQYIYRPPRWLRARMMDPVKNRIYVEDTPAVFLEAVRDGKNIEFDPDNIYHFKNESVSYPDEAFGMPPLLAAFKEAWLYQVYKRAQEAVALEHVLPLTVISPAPIPGAVNAAPHMNYSLSNFSSKVDHMIRRWRRDQNAIFTMPFPFTVENIRGDAAALNIQPQMEQSRQMIIGALDLPQEFIYGGLSYTGSSVSLRTVENVMINRIGRNNEFIEWVRARSGRYFDLPVARIYHTDFKMADDPQQKQIALGLRATNTVSDETTLKELGFEYKREMDRREKERSARNAEMEEMIVAQARAQAEGQRIQMVTAAKAEVEAMVERQKAMQAAGIQQDPNTAAMNQMAGPRVSSAAGPAPAGTITNPDVLKGSLRNAMKTMAPQQLDQYIDTISKTNPTAGMKFREMMGEMARDQQSVKMTQMQQEQDARQTAQKKTG